MERPLLYYATSLTGNPDDGLDVLQDVWMRVLRRIGELREPAALRAWLYRMTHGIAVDRIRRSRSRERVEKEQYAEFDEAEEPSFAEEDAAAIHEALGELGLKQQLQLQVLELRASMEKSGNAPGL
jgi:RNA polymerase sigma-70 factor (ECF subfamily)